MLPPITIQLFGKDLPPPPPGCPVVCADWYPLRQWADPQTRTLAVALEEFYPAQTDNLLQIFAIQAIVRFEPAVCVHAGAVVHRGSGLLFGGPSGAGKSTVCSWLASCLPVVHDDRSVLRLRQGRVELLNVPGLFGGAAVRLPPVLLAKHLFLLRQAKKLATFPVSRARVLAVVLNRLFDPADTVHQRRQLELGSEIVTRLLCQELAFPAEAGALRDFILSLSG